MVKPLNIPLSPQYKRGFTETEDEHVARILTHWSWCSTDTWEKYRVAEAVGRVLREAYSTQDSDKVEAIFGLAKRIANSPEGITSKGAALILARMFADDGAMSW